MLRAALGKTEGELLLFEAGEAGWPEAWADAKDTIAAPGREIAEYRFRLER